ncbi:MAG: hypothetical protein JKY22_05215 [Flavobacteriaceae bacterium]|nr:hypothetical protein [Flavobacteriaceae bacterium]
MFSKVNLVSTLVATVWGVAGGFLLWGIIADPLMADHMGMEGIMKDPPDIMYLILGCLVQGFAFSTIYGKISAGSYDTASGIQYGILVAILVGLGGGLINYATGNLMDLTGTFMNFGIYLFFFAVMGLLAGLIYTKMN